MPKLILHALQVNIMGGRLPQPENNGRRYFKIPIGALWEAAWEDPFFEEAGLVVLNSAGPSHRWSVAACSIPKRTIPSHPTGRPVPPLSSGSGLALVGNQHRLG